MNKSIEINLLGLMLWDQCVVYKLKCSIYGLKNHLGNGSSSSTKSCFHLDSRCLRTMTFVLDD